VKESHLNRDGSSEVDAFREYFPSGEVYVDEPRGFYSALGKRFLLSAISAGGISYYRQRVQGVIDKDINGNLNGALCDPFLLGGILLVAPSSQIIWAHKEGNGEIDYEKLNQSMAGLSKALKEREPSGWLERMASSFFR